MTANWAVGVRLLVVVAGLVGLGGPAMADPKAWGPWNEDVNHKGIYIRAGYDYFNEFSAKKGKPAHVWCIEINNRLDTSIGISWVTTDDNVTERPKSNSRNSSIKSGAVQKSCLQFTNTPPGGRVTVWTDKFVVNKN